MKRSPKLVMPLIILRRNGEELRIQLYRALRGAIAGGRLAPGRRLPSSRVLARKLGVSRNTVLAAYEALEAEGLLTGRVGSGTRVCSQPAALVQELAAGPPDRLRRLRESGFPLRRVAMRDPDDHPVYLHS